VSKSQESRRLAGKKNEKGRQKRFMRKKKGKSYEGELGLARLS